MEIPIKKPAYEIERRSVLKAIGALQTLDSVSFAEWLQQSFGVLHPHLME